MKIGLIITLGTRDVKIDRSYLESKFGPEKMVDLYTQGEKPLFLARPGGAFLFKQKKHLKTEMIKMPIIAPAIDWLYRNHRGETIDQIILVATDQEAEPVKERFKNNDSLHFAELIAYFIPKLFKDWQQQFAIHTQLIRKDVVFLDAMYDQFSRLLRDRPFNKLWGFDRIYLLNQGGIDAINTALLLNGLNIFVNRMHLLSVDEGSQSCSELHFPEKYLMEFTKSQLDGFLETYNYAAIKNLEVSDDVKALAAYAEHRLNFDFEEAKFAISKLTDYTLKNQLIEAMQMIETDEFEKLREVYRNAKIKYRQEAYVDFLFRLFRLVEGIAKFYACKHLGLHLNIHTWARDIKKLLEKAENRELKKHLEGWKVGNGQSLDLARAPTIAVWLAILNYYDPNTQGALQKIVPLTALRNNSIGAHNFDPVSIFLIDQALEKENLDRNFLFEQLDNLFQPDTPFSAINEKIKKIARGGEKT